MAEFVLDSGFIPTMTAFGEPHSALAPVWLLRQTISMAAAVGGALTGVLALLVGAEALGGWARWQLVKPANAKRRPIRAVERFVI